MSSFDKFVEKMKTEKEGFKELYEQRKVGHIIETYRLSQKITQEVLAEKTGLKQSAISRFEKGGNSTWKTIRTVLDGLGLDIEINERKIV